MALAMILNKKGIEGMAMSEKSSKFMKPKGKPITKCAKSEEAVSC